MDDVRYPVWNGRDWIPLPVPSMGGEPLVVPNVAGLVSKADAGRQLLLQRRDKPGEPTRGLLEIPVGRWRAGEGPEAALRREIEEETGLVVASIGSQVMRVEAHPGRPFEAVMPLLVTVGVEGAYPALTVVFACTASGEPRPLPGETADPRWYGYEEVQAMLGEPSRFTGPTFVALQHLFRAQA